MIHKYAGAMQGYGAIFKTLKRLWSSRFAGIKAFILIPDEHTKITLSVQWNASTQEHNVLLTQHNWQRNVDKVLYQSVISDIPPKRSTRIND